MKNKRKKAEEYAKKIIIKTPVLSNLIFRTDIKSNITKK